jgi:hypothetical protein
LFRVTLIRPYPGWWDFDIDALGLADGAYEYEFLLDGEISPSADPYADEITRFGGYRGVFRVAGKQRSQATFRWDDEFTGAPPLKSNNEIVIYEMPIKWMASDPSENPLVELGTFDKLVFEHLDYITTLGVNCIELLPIQDTSQTLNWGYGTRFYFAPDYDLGPPIDARFFIKTCHQRGIRVILDVVMNFFDPSCPLAQFAPAAGPAWFSVASGTDGRQDWGQILFRFNTPSYDAYFAAREFLCEWLSSGFGNIISTDIGSTISPTSEIGSSGRISVTGPPPRARWPSPANPSSLLPRILTETLRALTTMPTTEARSSMQYGTSVTGTRCVVLCRTRLAPFMASHHARCVFSTPCLRPACGMV